MEDIEKLKGIYGIKVNKKLYELTFLFEEGEETNGGKDELHKEREELLQNYSYGR
ncbi:hypothetical protein PMY56_13400 [Clostridium tertium]|uniref:hypothetical protein n=1 Tax=Clostridium tertium TaxID=1559 RepID=UPI00232D500B|nr:hypothetical protein [Clostridium tertium]MDB1924107.1 hypothetical protein [Clostridium tertium]MDB1927132.1 hypothetical protein [Clostridium tertium]MDB1930909.1 hypothetical protein [Clostridium tertium]